MYVRSFFILLLASLSMPAIAMEDDAPPFEAPLSLEDPRYNEQLRKYFQARNRQMTPPPPTKSNTIDLQAYFKGSGYYSDPGQWAKK